MARKRARLADCAATGYPSPNLGGGGGSVQPNHGSGRFEENHTYTDGQVVGILVVQAEESGIFDLAAWLTYTLTSGTDSNLSFAVITGDFTVNGSPPAAGFFENPSSLAGGTEEVVGRAFDNAAGGEPATLSMTDLVTTGAAKGDFVGFLLIAHVTGEGADITVNGTGAPAGSIRAIELL